MTYLLAGSNEHRDSAGHRGMVQAGGAQWMRAGRGVLHSERIIAENATIEHGLQLWSRMPVAMQDDSPSYRGIAPEDVPNWAEDATMGQRLSRAKAKISSARIPFAVPEPEQWPERLNAVLSVIYLIFNAGYRNDPNAGNDLAEEAIWLARTLDMLCPADPEIEGLLALLLITHARRNARLNGAGVTVPLSKQDRNLWDRQAIEEGTKLTELALGRKKPGAYQIKAAIAACHCEGDASDWRQIAALYDVLLTYEPTDVVQLNRAVAIAEAGALQRGLALFEGLASALAHYQPFHAAQAELLGRSGQVTAAMCAYDQAIALAQSPADITFLAHRRDALVGCGAMTIAPNTTCPSQTK
jgi:predicted RNA polymerase sigma factor